MSGRAAVIGTPVSHSLSPAMHRAAFASMGVDWTYEAIECDAESLPSFLAGATGNGFGGLSVTMPLKETIVPLLSRLEGDARVLAAVNCVSVADGALTGHNTDGEGCCDALVIRGGVNLAGARCVVLGAGGTARSVCLAMAGRGAVVRVVNRTAVRTENLVAMVRGRHPHADIAPGSRVDIRSAAVLVNATSVGMNTDECPVDPADIRGGLVVLDAVYTPLQTALLRAAEKAGAVTVDGLWMLVHQALRQQTIWFGRCADADLMRTESLRELASRPK